MVATTYPAAWRRGTAATPLDLTQPLTREAYIETLDRVMYEIKQVVREYRWCSSWWIVGGRLHPWFNQNPDSRDGEYGSLVVPEDTDAVNTEWFTPEGLAAYNNARGLEYAEQLRLLRGRILRCASDAYDTRQITAANVNQILNRSGLGGYIEPVDTRAYSLYIPGVNVRTTVMNNSEYQQVVNDAWRVFMETVNTAGLQPMHGEVEVSRNHSGDRGIIPIDATEPYLPTS